MTGLQGLTQLAFNRPLEARSWLQASNPSERWKWDFMYQDLPPVKGNVDPTALPLPAGAILSRRSGSNDKDTKGRGQGCTVMLSLLFPLRPSLCFRRSRECADPPAQSRSCRAYRAAWRSRRRNSARGPALLALPEGLHTQSNKPRDPLLIPTELTIDAPADITVKEVVFRRQPI